MAQVNQEHMTPLTVAVVGLLVFSLMGIAIANYASNKG